MVVYPTFFLYSNGVIMLPFSSVLYQMKPFKSDRLHKILPALQETLLHGLLAVVITASVMTFPLDFIEAPLYDLRQWLSLKPEADSRIAIITIDDQTLNQLNELNPLPLSYHHQAVQKLEAQGVR